MKLGLVVVLVASACKNSATPGADATVAVDTATPDAAAPPIDPDTLATSGSRIKLVWNVTDDGVRSFAGFHDTLRNEDCAPTKFADGLTYCAPRFDDNDVVYADTACATAPIGIRAAGCSPSSHYLFDCGAPDFLQCSAELLRGGGAIQHLYPRGADTTLTGVKAARIEPSGSCSIATANEYDGTYATLGAEVNPATDLARMTLGDPVGTSRLQLRFLETADGMRIATSTFDAQFHQDCEVQMQWTQPHCRPDVSLVDPGAQGGHGGTFSDSSCSRVVAPVNDPNGAVFGSEALCGPLAAATYLGSGDHADAIFYWRYTNGSFVCDALSTSDTYYSPGPEVLAQPVTVHTEATATRLRRKLIDAPGYGLPLTNAEYAKVHEFPFPADPGPILHDTVLDADCTFVSLADGTGACLPITRVQLREVSTEPDCAQPFSVAIVRSSECAISPVFEPGTLVTGILHDGDEPVCSAGAGVYQLGASIGVAVYEVQPNNECQVVFLGDVHRVTPIAPDMIAHATRSITQ